MGEFRVHPEWLLRSILGQIIWLGPWIFFPLISEFFKLVRSKRENPISSFLKSEPQRTLKWINGSAIATLAVTFLLLLHTETGILKKITGLDNNNSIIKLDPTIEGYDYKDLQ